MKTNIISNFFCTVLSLLFVAMPLSAEQWRSFASGSGVSVASAYEVLPSKGMSNVLSNSLAFNGQNFGKYQNSGDYQGFAKFSPAPEPSPVISQDMEIDRVLVEKARKRMLLLRGDAVVREYAIALGKNPVGHKKEEGDGKTPEGRYILDWRNPESKFHRSIHISYPNDADISSAEAAGRDPGEYIMIHGSPDWVPSSDWARKWYNKDWTDGCIAVTNDEMDEIWRLVADGTPIEIKP